MKLRDWVLLTPIFLRCLGKLPLRHLLYLAKQFRNEQPKRHETGLHVNAFFPPYPSKAFDRFLDSVIERRRVPYSVYFAVTDRCPFDCPHCSYGMHQAGEMGTEEAVEVIEQIKSLGTPTIGFTGGEPLLRDDIVELVRACGDELASVMFTTGCGLDSQLADELRRAGLGCIMIGMESSDAGEHDAVRGVEGSFEQAIRTVELSRSAGLYTAVSTVATREKVRSGQIEKLARLAGEYGVHEFRVLEPVPTGSFCKQENEVLGSEESERLADFHKRWNRRNKGPAVSGFSYLESDEMFGCGAGFHHLFIDAVGNVCPCDLTPLSFGNVLDESLESIWLRMGETFELPRCGCLMKDICGQTYVLKNAQELPIDPERSLKVCEAVKKDGPLPKVYKNLLKGRKPVSRPENRQ
ncbi:Antilisterial bacteriocin subtilosin biosynthesis protein AlbA [Anaerohalosphaera lusitana]|uniref:Antilisterial bacteriocin subtilosin biosynthesis protein AlbA n=1 Tax=Anaerohalosphaera lusitana TaxID=1936003 RepID=A0A1U9NJ86_9BACT|nr:radical SAM protein [Anaerohalosphaera lusitana]AQT67794.1 Antilisterial bacteriocin subtilosin biosynthesis protein AlbA [Anaerohalosphaera lusitana]